MVLKKVTDGCHGWKIIILYANPPTNQTFIKIDFFLLDRCLIIVLKEKRYVSVSFAPFVRTLR